MRDLQNFIAFGQGVRGELLQEETVPLDETCPWNELYTKRALRGKRQNVAALENKQNRTAPGKRNRDNGGKSR